MENKNISYLFLFSYCYCICGNVNSRCLNYKAYYDKIPLVLTPKVFLVDVNTGSVDVPKSITGGKCEIVSSTGSVKIAIAE